MKEQIIDYLEPKEIERIISNSYRLDILMNYLGYEYREHQDFICTYITSRYSSLLLTPRCFGKTTIYSVVLPILNLIKNKTTLLVTKNASISEMILFEIEKHINDDKFKYVFGELDINKVNVCGINEQIPIKKLDSIIMDDIEDYLNPLTNEERYRILSNYKNAIELLLYNMGTIHITGTRYDNSIYNTIKEVFEFIPCLDISNYEGHLSK